MDVESGERPSNFSLLWLWATAIGFAVGGVAGVLAGFPAGFAVGLVAGGAASVLLQGLLLRRRVGWAPWWVLASIGGLAVGVGASLATGWFETGLENFTTVDLLLSCAVLGLSMGTLQWLVLRRHVSHAGWWIMASIAGLVVGVPVGRVIGMTVGLLAAVVARMVTRGADEVGLVITLIAGLAAVGVVLGDVTGRTLLRLLLQPRADADVDRERGVAEQQAAAPVPSGRHDLLLWMSWVVVCAGAGVAARTTGQFMSLLVVGFAFGAAQALVLGRQPPQSSVNLWAFWVAFSTVGGVVGFGLGGTAASMVDERPGLLGNHLGMVAFGVVLWTVVGAAQWLVLRLYVPRAAWWVLASAAGGLAWAAAELAITGDAALYGAVTGTCYGAVTGLALAWLFPDVGMARQPWLAAIPIVVAGLLVARATATRDVCDAQEQAALAQFPQYGGLQLTPRTDEAGGCVVYYRIPDTPASVEQLTTYFAGQFARHGWTREPPGPSSHLGGQLSARRGDVRYSIFYASNAYNIPPEPTIQLSVQVRTGPAPAYMQQPPVANPNTASSPNRPGPAPTPDLQGLRSAPAPAELGSVVLPADATAIRTLFARLPPQIVGYAWAPQFERNTAELVRAGYGEDRRLGSGGSGGPPLVITAIDLAKASGFPPNWAGGHVVGQMGQPRAAGNAGRDGDLVWLRQDPPMGNAEFTEHFPAYTLLWGRIDSPWIFSVTADTPENRDALLAAFVAAARVTGQ